MSHWFRRIRRRVRDSHGIALITTLFIVFTLGMMLFAFGFMMQGEVGFASLNRNSTVALNLAEAGIQEAINRLNQSGGTPGTTTYANSLANSTASPGSSGTVTYQAALQSDSTIFPILSTATFTGVQRAVRIFEQAKFKTGLGNVTYGSSVICEGPCRDTTADVYQSTFIIADSYAGSPLCSAGTTATNLLSPELLAGTGMRARPGTNVTPPCGSPVNAGTYAYECASGSLIEVAPTPCARTVSGGFPAPFNWHPMTPVGMTSADFNTVVTQCPPTTNPCTAALGITVSQATQSATGVTYTPKGTYTPSYWTTIPTTNTQVLLATASQPFCVRSSPVSVVLPSPPVTGTCPAGYNRYTNYNDPEITTALAGIPQYVRFVDWGLVQDDLSSGTAATFFQAPTCSTCNGGGPNGYQNGIRYIPILPTVNVLGQACTVNVTPGTNVFDKVISSAINCSPPISQITATSVTFTGTQSNPESLVVDNFGSSAVTISGSLPGSGTETCSTTNWNNYNWGMILTTGDLTLAAGFVFTGFIYAGGNILIPGGTVVVHGGMFSGGKGINDFPATVHICGGPVPTLDSPVFVKFQQLTWQDRPANMP